MFSGKFQRFFVKIPKSLKVFGKALKKLKEIVGAAKELKVNNRVTKLIQVGF